jgi:hypothetical protein
MKKLSLILILVMMFSLCSCAKQEVIIEDDVSDLELFEFLRPNEFIPDIDTLYHDFTDIVIIATPTTSFKDAKHVILNDHGMPCEIEDAKDMISFTSRHFKIEKVLSGDKEMTEIDIKEFAFTDGKTLKIRNGDKLFKAGHRYLLFAKKSETEDYPYISWATFDLAEEISPDNYKYEDYLKAKELFPEAFE